jgi:protein SCO1/2
MIDLACLKRAALATAIACATGTAPGLAAAGASAATLADAPPAAKATTPPPAASTWPRDSLYRLDVPLTDQAGRTFSLADHHGSPMIVSMFYTSCQYACPMLIEAVRANEEQLTEAERRRLAVVLVSFDPKKDSVAVLKKTAGERHVDGTRWQLARTEDAHVRQVAAALDIPYRRLDNGEFNHGTTLVLVDGEGRIVGRTSDLSGADPAFVKLVKTTLASAAR